MKRTASTRAAAYVAAFLLFIRPSDARAQADGPPILTGAVVNTLARGDFDWQHYWGWMGSFSANLTPRFGLVAEASGEYRGDPYNSSYDFHTLVGGPRFGRLSGHARPYLQLPVGWIHSSTTFRLLREETYTDNLFIFQPGGGVDVAVTDRLAVRLGADYVVGSPWHLQAWQFYNVRFVTGVTYSLR
jgi:hypothetical protein